MKELTLAEMKSVNKIKPDGDLGDRLQELLDYGAGIFESDGTSRVPAIWKLYNEALSSGRTPVILLGDNTPVGNSTAWTSIPQADIEKWHNDVWDFETWSESFAAACMS